VVGGLVIISYIMKITLVYLSMPITYRIILQKIASNKTVSRVLENITSLFFKEDTNKGLYFMNSAKRETKVEVTDQNNSFTNLYEISLFLTTSKSFNLENIKSNTIEHKDLFKIKHPYDHVYWGAQNQLLLTEEMQAFIHKLGKENTEFKVRSNID